MRVNFFAKGYAITFYLLSFVVGAKEVVVAFPQHIPPWVIQGNNSGISLDILAQALAFRGHTLVPKYIPFARMSVVLQDDRVDAVTMVEGKKVTGDYFYSEITTRFTTSLISLKQQDFTLETMSNLKDKRVLAFQDASKVFPALEKLGKASPLYQEMANQESQVALLFKQRVDLILLDRSIFYYWRNTINYVNTSAGVTFHDLSSISALDVDSPTQTVFKDKTLRDDFNFGLRRLRNSGLYQQIINRYLRWCTPTGSRID